MSKRPLCTSPNCRARGQHRDGCTIEGCGGCQPRQAAQGAYLCSVCTRRLAENITELAELHGELAVRLAYGSGGAGEKTAGKPGSRVPNPTIMQRRDHVRLVLVTWARIIVEQRGVMPPPDEVGRIAAFLGRHVDWLAAQPFADEASSQFAKVSREAFNTAYPNGTRTIEVGRCQKTTDDQPCEGVIKAILRRSDSLLPSSIICDVNDSHTWPPNEWLRLGRQLKVAA